MKTRRRALGMAVLLCTSVPFQVLGQSTGGLPALREELVAETNRAVSEEQGLSASISQAAANILAEAARAKGAEATLDGRLQSETTQRVDVDSILQADVTAEGVRATAAEVALGMAIEAERAARAQAIGSEIAERQAACNAEAAARQAEIASLQSQIASLQAAIAAASSHTDLLTARETIALAATRLSEAESLIASVENGSASFDVMRAQIANLANESATRLASSLARLTNAANVVGGADARAQNALIALQQQAVFDALAEEGGSSLEAAKTLLKQTLAQMAEMVQRQQANVQAVLAAQ